MDRSAPPIRLAPERAALPRLVIAALAALALGSLALTRLPVLAVAIVAALVVLEAFRADRAVRTMLRARYALQPDGGWRVEREGRAYEARLVDHAVLGPLVALQFVHEEHARSALVLWPGAVGPDSARALRVWLRFGTRHDRG